MQWPQQSTARSRGASPGKRATGSFYQTPLPPELDHCKTPPTPQHAAWYTNPLRREIIELGGPVAEMIRHHRSHWAWTCLSVGCLDEACRVSEEENDIIAWAASVALIGDTGRALIILESYIVATSVIIYEQSRRHSRGRGFDAYSVVRRHNEVALSWMENHRRAPMRAAGNSIRLFDEEHREVVRQLVGLVDWAELHRWYIIALILHGDTAAAAAYTAPLSRWFRYCFSLLGEDTSTDPVSTSKHYSSTRRKVPPLSIMSLDDVLATLLSQCDEVEVHFITAVVAYRTRRYRTCMTSASQVISECCCSNEEPLASSVHLTRYEPDFMRFVRCLSGLHIGERTQVAVDITALMGNSSSYVSIIGCCMAAYGMSLRDAEETAIMPEGPPIARHYAYSLCEYVHALTLMQLGLIEQALEVAKTAISFSPPHDVGYNFCDLIVYGSVALEDATTILETSLSPHRLLYIALCPAFFGGLTTDGIRVKSDSSTFQLLYPTTTAGYSSVRRMLPYHMNRAIYLFSNQKLREAWEEVCCAVAAADEVVGSLEFAFSDCCPLRVYYSGCQVGMALLELLLQEEVDAVATCLKYENNVEINDAKDMVLRANDELSEVVVVMCQQWAQQMRHFFPYARLSEVAQVQLAVVSREKQMLSRAIMLSRRYPRSILAQNTMTLALYFDHHIPEAVNAAQKNLQDFPHSRDVIAMHKLLQRKNIVYSFNYRTLLPLRYSPCTHERLFTKRMIIVIILLSLNFIIMIITAIFNVPKIIGTTQAVKQLAIRLQLPSVIPLFFGCVFIVHAIVATVVPMNLVRTMLSDIHFCDTPLNRFLFAVRGIALVNVVNALQISFAGNNFLISNTPITILLYLLLTVLFAPFTTRAWFLPSLDEPNVGILSWLTLLCVDTVIAVIIVLPHILLAALEPFMSIIFYFFPPAERPVGDAVSSSIRRRLLYHEHHRYEMPARFSNGSGSNFIHIRLMAFLYYQTHSRMETRRLAESQMEEENYRIFPLLDPELVGTIKEEPIHRYEQLANLFLPRQSKKDAGVAATAVRRRERRGGRCTTGDRIHRDGGNANGECARPVAETLDSHHCDVPEAVASKQPCGDGGGKAPDELRVVNAMKQRFQRIRSETDINFRSVASFVQRPNAAVLEHTVADESSCKSSFSSMRTYSFAGSAMTTLEQSVDLTAERSLSEEAGTSSGGHNAVDPNNATDIPSCTEDAFDESEVFMMMSLPNY